YYYRARYYDPASGRFLSEDPAGFDADTDFYAYVGNSPIDWSDPQGLKKARVCRRHLLFKPLWFWNHTFIQFLDDAGMVTDTYGILGNPGTSKNQIPRHGNGQFEDPRPGDQRPVQDRNTTKNPKNCKDLNLSECQLDELKEDLDHAVAMGACPSCGA